MHINEHGQWVNEPKAFKHYAILPGSHFAFWKMTNGRVVYRLNEPYRSLVSGCAYLIFPNGYDWVVGFGAEDAKTFYVEVLGYGGYLEIERRYYSAQWPKIRSWADEEEKNGVALIEGHIDGVGTVAQLFFPSRATETRFQIECL